MDNKSWYASQTIWGGVAAIGAGLGGAYASWKMGDMGGMSAGLMAAFGGVQAIIGRFKATATIGAAPAAK
jgi:hypothetical protein